MMRLLFLCVGLLVGGAQAEGLTTERPAVLYDAPSVKARAKAILVGDYPVKQVSRVDGWRKVFTYGGDEGWLAESDIRAAQGAVVVVERAVVRSDPHPQGAPIFYAKRGVILEILRRGIGEWVQVLHADGESGYIVAADIWQNF